MKRLLYLLFFSVALVSHGYSNSDDVVLIAHRDVPDMDANDLKKAYLGKLHTLKDINLVPIHSQSGSPLKKTFLQRFINQDEESYTGYWNVRRYIGKDVPPIEMKSSQEMISFVENNSGSIGYIDKASSLAINNSSVKILTY